MKETNNLKWKIRWSSTHGQGCYDTQTKKYRKEERYEDGMFEATAEEARKILEEAKGNFRGKWCKLYKIEGA